MSDTQQPSAPWDEDRIVDSIQAKSTDEPRMDVYNQVEWVTDDVAIGLAMEVYKDMRAEIAALQAQLAAAHAGTYRPIEGNITFARNGNLFVVDANALDGLPFPDGVRLCALQPGSPLGKGGDDAPVPDWSAAPSWSNWWAVDPNGWAHWFQEEPVLALTINYSGWIPKTVNGIQIGMELWAAELDLALGIDWRLLRQRRQAASGVEKEGDDA